MYTKTSFVADAKTPATSTEPSAILESLEGIPSPRCAPSAWSLARPHLP